jgi:hypothetical protein
MSTELLSPKPPVESESEPQTMLAIIDRAIRMPDLDVAKLQALLDMKERWDATNAKRAFVSALNRFKEHPPVIDKNKHVYYETKNGPPVDYWHATLDHVCEIVAKELTKYGFSYRWQTSQDQGAISVTCVLTHEQGHSESTTLHGAADTTGGKNSIQAVGSTVTYLERYTLLAAVGLAAENTDDDARSSSGMSNDDIAEQCEFMANACNLRELETLYKNAANLALDKADKRAIAIFKEAKKKKAEEF